jgi:hypothetical protein
MPHPSRIGRCAFWLVAALAAGCADAKHGDRNLDAFLTPDDDSPAHGSDGGARDLGGALPDATAPATADLGAAAPHDLAAASADLAGHTADLAAPPDLAGPPADLAGAHPDLAGAPPVYASDAKTLYSVDPTTWEITRIGSFGISDDVTDIAVLPDGRLMASTSDMLYTVNLSTGAATAAVSSLVSWLLPSNIEGLSALADGELLLCTKSGDVDTISDLSSNSITLNLIGNLRGFTLGGDVAATGSGALFATADSGGGATAGNNQLLTVSSSSGRGTARGAIGYGNLRGLVPVGGRLVGFSSTGDIVGIDPTSGAGTRLKQHAGTSFTGAATSPSVTIP